MQHKRFPVFAERFNKLRGEMTQDEFAELLEVSRPTIGFYENGSRLPDALMLRKIAERCNVSADYLLGLEDEPHREYSDVMKATGLTDRNILKLAMIKSETERYHLPISFPDLVELRSFRELLIMCSELKSIAHAAQRQIRSTQDTRGWPFEWPTHEHTIENYVNEQLEEMDIPKQVKERFSLKEKPLLHALVGRDFLDFEKRRIIDSFSDCLNALVADWVKEDGD